MNARDRAAKASHKTFKFTVDGVHCESEESRQTGAAIKAAAGVDMSLGLFLEGRGKHEADRPIGDNDVVDLAQPGTEQFYTAPGATFGTRREA